MKECTLRQKKHAQTKIAIMKVFIKRLEQNHFDDISIREVCHDAEIAEGTFFNYFPEKFDVIAYYLYMTTMKIIWETNNEVPAGKYLSLIKSTLTHLSHEFQNNNVTYQIFSLMLVQTQLPKEIYISNLEKKLAFPGCKGIEEIPAMDIPEWLKKCVILAEKNGEFPPNTNTDDVFISLITITTGTLAAMRLSNIKKLGYHYTRQLEDLWRVLGVSK